MLSEKIPPPFDFIILSDVNEEYTEVTPFISVHSWIWPAVPALSMLFFELAISLFPAPVRVWERSFDGFFGKRSISLSRFEFSPPVVPDVDL